MQGSGLPVGVRFLAYAAAIVIGSAILAAAIMNLRAAAELREQLLALGTESEQRDARLERQVQDVSRRLDELAGATGREIASARRGAHGEVARLGNRLTGSLSSVQGRLDDLASQLRSRPSQEGAAPSPEAPGEKPPRGQTAAAATTQSPQEIAAAREPELASEQDLRVIHLLEEGKSLFESAEYFQAQKSFQRVLLLQPRNTDAMLFSAASLYRANPADADSYPVVEKNLRVVLLDDGENPLALETLAMVAMERQKWPDAIDYLKRLINVRPRNAAILRTAGFCALKSGDISGAEDYFRSASLLAPNDGEILSFLGDCEWALGSGDKAEKSWTNAMANLDLRTASGSRAGVALREKLARSAYDRGAYGGCLAYAQEVVGQGKTDLLRAYEGLCFMALGKREDGKAILRQLSMSTDPQAAALAEKGLEEGP